ncbi:DNA-binding response regulator [Paludibacter sp. 221]|uniref:response regulator transcription factor n=1 Tax=Paludibacter sp. 221 TaxID=2302939 RepID=UPI0013D4595D|nr:LuxR C-terminal-related transcriptional regulator [Paludibacter sp. 221]NDV46489.1 DNA-binding response regulator [Paludibacter sp. 221]
MQSEDNLLKVLIAEPSAIIRNGLSVTLKRIPGSWIQPVEISSIENLEHVLETNKPDVLIINPNFWGYVDMTTVRAWSAASKLKIIALVSSLSSDVILKKYDESISIYDSPEDIKEKIFRLFDTSDTEKDKSSEESETLSSREKEIVVLVVKGLTNKEIAQKLFLSTHTIITHRRNIARKLEIHSTAGLTVYAIVNKLVGLDEIKDNFTL